MFIYEACRPTMILSTAVILALNISSGAAINLIKHQEQIWNHHINFKQGENKDWQF
jgi:hypothetical protein